MADDDVLDRAAAAERRAALMSDEGLARLAKAAGFTLESWMTNPPKPAMWHGTPEALRAFAQALLKERV